MVSSKNNSSVVSAEKDRVDVQPLKKVPFAVSEAYKSIRTNLMAVLKKENRKILSTE